jgi:hypothetical protein
MLAAVGILLLVLLASCSGGTSPIPDDNSGDPPVVVTPDPIGETPDPVGETPDPIIPKPGDQGASDDPLDFEFDVDVLPESFRFGGSVEDATVTWSQFDGANAWWNTSNQTWPDGIVAEIYVEGAEDLKGLFVDLSYESSRLRLEYAYCGNYSNPDLEDFEAPGAADALFAVINPPINFGLLPEQTGHMRLGGYQYEHESSSGFTGDAILIRAYFVITPDPLLEWPATGSPYTVVTASDCQNTVGYAGGKLGWSHNLVGDFNQDGSADFWDWAEISVNFEDIADGIDSIAGLMTGAADGKVWLEPCGPRLGMHFTQSVDSFRVYVGAPSAYPNGGALAGTVNFSSAIGDPEAERLRFEYSMPAGVPGTQAWVVPVYDGVEGVPSTAHTF